MCRIEDEDKLQAISVMLNGNALDFFDEYQDGFKTHEDAFRLLGDNYMSTEQRTRILIR